MRRNARVNHKGSEVNVWRVLDFEVPDEGSVVADGVYVRVVCVGM